MVNRNGMIIADARERASGIPDLLRRMGVDVKIKQLRSGDYLIGQNVAVERKTIVDMLASIDDGRLLSQCKRLKSCFNAVIIILEGVDNDLQRLADGPTRVYRALATIVLSHGISVVSTPSPTHTAKFLKELHCRHT